MALGREVGLSPSDIVLDGDPAPPSPSTPEVHLSPGHIVLEGTQLLARERGTATPSFGPMSIVATVAHLSYC